MTLILDMNDMGVRCFDSARLLHESPGVALVDSDRLLFGKDALQFSRSQPLHTHTRFWSQLDVTPLHSDNHQVRHHADLAYWHLKHIESQLQQPLQGQDVVFALSGQSDKQALGLLLGIASQCGLKTVGMMDTALACVLPAIRHPQASHIELHQHHAVVSELELKDGKLSLAHLEVLPQLGWLDLQQHLLRYLSSQFIRQTRFNPRHDADSEQLLFDAIPGYLQQAESQRVLECQLPSHGIKLDARLLCDEVQSWLQPLNDKLSSANATSELYIGDRLSRLGMFLAPTNQPRHLTLEQVSAALHNAAGRLPRVDDNLRFTSTLTCQNQPRENPQQPASHLLCASRAYPLAGTWSLLNDRQQPLQAGASDAALAIVRNNRIHPNPGVELFVNGQPLVAERGLQRGDKLSLGQQGPVYELISVEG